VAHDTVHLSCLGITATKDPGEQSQNDPKRSKQSLKLSNVKKIGQEMSITPSCPMAPQSMMAKFGRRHTLAVDLWILWILWRPVLLVLVVAAAVA